MDFLTKNMIIEKSSKGSNLRFINSSTDFYARDSQSGKLLAANYISTSDLSIIMYHFNTSYNGVPMDDLYSSFEWLRSGNGPSQSPGGFEKDMIGIAVPDGWEIQSDKYACAATAYVAPTGGWGNPTSAFCSKGNGEPVEYSLYGAAWQFDGNYSSTNTYYKGTVGLTMKKKLSTAINRAVSKYSEAKNNSSGYFAVGVTWGPVSITYYPTGGSSNNEASKDITWL
ncbi:hypothetical protein [Cohnella lupini]|uniref:Uncharacterized protein n=1 Tax=Cohnella lupini TaxID=1294267 RepID=A0A3D9HUD7_9BACL|nr:hypothetical protein [Cohnella lupini]RED52991.1 hypothetical protein DFP95_12850 [Cohnella lupini]